MNMEHLSKSRGREANFMICDQLQRINENGRQGKFILVNVYTYICLKSYLDSIVLDAVTEVEILYGMPLIVNGRYQTMELSVTVLGSPDYELSKCEKKAAL